MGDLRETAVNYIVGEKIASFYTAEKSYIENIKKWSKEYPKDVIIRHVNNDGSILCQLPKSWVKIRPPRKMSEEQKNLASERFKNMWKERNIKSQKEDTDV